MSLPNANEASENSTTDGKYELISYRAVLPASGDGTQFSQKWKHTHIYIYIDIATVFCRIGIHWYSLYSTHATYIRISSHWYLHWYVDEHTLSICRYVLASTIESRFYHSICQMRSCCVQFGHDIHSVRMPLCFSRSFSSECLKSVFAVLINYITIRSFSVLAHIGIQRALHGRWYHRQCHLSTHLLMLWYFFCQEKHVKKKIQIL